MAYIPIIENTCGPTQYATCIIFEGTIPSISDLVDDNSNSVEEILADNYTLLSNLYTITDLTGLGANGLPYVLNVDNEITVKAAIETHGDEIVSLKADIADLLTGFDGDLDISTWGLDFNCLEGDSCGNPIITLKQLFQALITYSCEGTTTPVATTTTVAPTTTTTTGA